MPRALFAILSLSMLSGCVRWELMNVAPETYLAGDTVTHARVLVVGGTPTNVDNLTLQADSLSGLLPHSNQPGFPPSRFTAPLDQVEEIRVRKYSFLDTLSIILIGLGATAMSLYLAGVPIVP